MPISTACAIFVLGVVLVMPVIHAYDEDSSGIGSVDFDWNKVARDLGEPLDETDEAKQSEARDMTAAAMNKLFLWVWQRGKNDKRGLAHRAAILCWVFLPQIHELSMTDLATGFGLHKQSIGRWVEDFKKAFPYLKNCNMQ